MNKSIFSDEVAEYIDRTFVAEPAVLHELREETATMPNAGMQIAADQGLFLSILVRASGAKRALEVGVFTGYSSLVTLLALPPDGTMVACDISDEYTQVARRYWAKAGLSHKIELKIGPALDHLDKMVDDNEVFDFVFIDADKANYCAYFERAVQLLRPNGLIAVDNTLWSGKVADMEDLSEGTVAIRQLNQMAAADPRVEACLVPIGDGITLARKL